MAKEKNYISEAVIRRLPKYYRYLSELDSRRIERISSKELSELMGLTASQIRQDFNCFGGFGQQGYGYNVAELRKEIHEILGLHNEYHVIIIGAGNLGQALANYTGFEEDGFNIEAIFDVNPRLIGMAIRGINIMDVNELESYISRHKVDIAVITTPKDRAQDIAERLVQEGVEAIWNFAGVDLKVPSNMIVENAHISDSLYTLSFRMGDEG